MRSRALSLAIALGSIALTACGGDDAADSPVTAPGETTTTVAKKTTTTTVGDSTTTTDGGEAADGLTPGGTELAVGETANVLYVTDAGDRAPLEVTVTAIERGDAADMAGFDLGDDAGKIPWYVRVTVTNKSEVDLSDELITLGLEAYDDRHEQLGTLIITGDFPQCNNDYAPEGFVGGAGFEVCEPYLLHPDGAVSSAFWNELDTPYFDQPVIWRAS
jgi:hypothetical protein